ncbi:unnamed protein product [Microthlaspi erraticum]|uniref:Reverse transcriptase Ty1/copia-type domain-containing protein n=1 Tax=Microthlaspi erraticum TaxID=1685480 RepID=A0A6D2JMR8_9BRAS|nr:unnamed protein product [Microthlaspi erraticum]
MALKDFLIQTGFTNSLSDTSLFIYCRDSVLLCVLVYVDNIIVLGNRPELVISVEKSLGTRFFIKDLCDIQYFLGIEVTRTSHGLHLMQRKYIVDLLTKTHMLDAKPITTPMATSPKLTLHSGKPLDSAKEYRMVVGSLQYLAFTRPDITFSVNKLSLYMHSPMEDHWQAAKRVFWYLAGMLTHGIFLNSSSTLTIHGFYDADWVGDVDDYNSTNAFIVYLGKNPISWSSKKLKGVARSSTEVDYRDVANTAAEIRWICSLLTELGLFVRHPPTVYFDNVGATYLCANLVFHSRMKHIALDYHFVREQIQSGILRVSHVSTHDQLADMLTKPLPRSHFQTSWNKLGVIPLPPS